VDQEALFSLIGKMYVDIVNAQRIIEALQKKIQDKDKSSEA
jgi:hypothetical protein